MSVATEVDTRIADLEHRLDIANARRYEAQGRLQELEHRYAKALRRLKNYRYAIKCAERMQNRLEAELARALARSSD